MTDRHRRWVLTGGIGTGKSTVRSLLEARSVAVIDADSVGHEVLEPDGPAWDEVAALWPEVVRGEVIDRGALAEIVFNDIGQLRVLESITHPHIFGIIAERVERFGDRTVVVELPLLEHRLGSDWGAMVVDCSDEARIQRATSRGMSREDVLSRMNVQPGRGEWLAAADMVVPNHGTLEDLEDTVSLLTRVI